MKLKPKFQARVKNGKLDFIDKVAVAAYMWTFKPTDILDVIISKFRNQRSVRQNRWYWGAILPIVAQATGASEDDLHEIFKRRFLPPTIITVFGKEHKVAGHTPDCDTKEFTDYIENIRALVAEYGINIPDPQAVSIE